MKKDEKGARVSGWRAKLVLVDSVRMFWFCCELWQNGDNWQISDQRVRRCRAKPERGTEAGYSKVEKRYLKVAARYSIIHCYIKNEEMGLHPQITHSHFSAQFTDALYYDCVTEHEPFGSNVGADTLTVVKRCLRSIALRICGSATRARRTGWNVSHHDQGFGSLPAAWMTIELNARAYW